MLSVVMTTISVRPRTMRIQSTTFCPVVMLGTSFQWRKEGRAKQPKVTAKLPSGVKRPQVRLRGYRMR